MFKFFWIIFRFASFFLYLRKVIFVVFRIFMILVPMTVTTSFGNGSLPWVPGLVTKTSWTLLNWSLLPWTSSRRSLRSRPQQSTSTTWSLTSIVPRSLSMLVLSRIVQIWVLQKITFNKDKSLDINRPSHESGATPSPPASWSSSPEASPPPASLHYNIPTYRLLLRWQKIVGHIDQCLSQQSCVQTLVTWTRSSTSTPAWHSLSKFLKNAIFLSLVATENLSYSSKRHIYNNRQQQNSDLNWKVKTAHARKMLWERRQWKDWKNFTDKWSCTCNNSR